MEESGKLAAQAHNVRRGDIQRVLADSGVGGIPVASIRSQVFKFAISKMAGSWDQIEPLALRAKAERMSRMSRPRRGVRVSPAHVGELKCEWLVPDGASAECAFMYIHGGGWVSGSPCTARPYVSRLAWESRVQAFSVDYRLAPEHPFPAPLDDCIDAYEWLIDTGMPPARLVLAGESSGGNLAMALLVALRDAGRPLPAGVVGISAITDLPNGAARDVFFGNMTAAYLDGHDPHDPLVSPMFADLHGMPPMLLHVGGDEMLKTDTVPFGERARAAGVQVETVVWPDMFHVFQTATFLPESRRANEEIASFIRARVA